MDTRKFNKLKSDFQSIWDEIDLHAIVLFGSHAREENHGTSDIDICVVLGEREKSPESLDQQIRSTLSKMWQNIGGKYDLWIFEELKINIQSAILDEYIIIFCQDRYLLGEYFYPFRKKAKTYHHRLKVAYGEI